MAHVELRRKAKWGRQAEKKDVEKETKEKHDIWKVRIGKKKGRCY